MRKEMKNNEQFMREVRKKRQRLIEKRARKERTSELLFKGALGLAGVGIFYLFFGVIGLAIVGAVTMVKKYIEIAE